MSSIYDLLAQIKNAVYGKDVRDAIHDSIEQCYDDATGTPESIAGAVADIQAYKEQTDALISNYESQFNTMMSEYEDRIDAQVDNLVANVKPNTVVNLWNVTFGTEPDGTTGDIYTLSDDISNYDYIDIYAQSSYGTPVRVKVDKSLGRTLAKVSNITSSGYPHEDNQYFIINETHISFADNGNEGVVTYTLMVTDRNGTQTYDWNDTEISPLTIERIDGIKIGADASAEIADLRVGEDGTVYQTAGAAVRGQIADVKEDLQELQEEIEGGGSGLTADLKAALDQLAQKVAYIDSDGQDYYDALHAALYPPANLTSISCVYTQSGTVYNTDSLDDLKTDLVVTAHFSDSTTQTVTTYTLSGTLTVGTSTITVSYGGKTTTFNVTVTQDESWDYEWYASSGVAPDFFTYSSITFAQDNSYATFHLNKNQNLFTVDDVGDMIMEFTASYDDATYNNNPQAIVRTSSTGGFKVFPDPNVKISTNISGSNAEINDASVTTLTTYRLTIENGICSLKYGTAEPLTELTGSGQTGSQYYPYTGITGSDAIRGHNMNISSFKYKKL